MKTSPLTIKHVPFESIYRQEYEVVEEHRGNLRLYPHTDQLPIISRAINLEFYGALPNKIAHVDHRADGFNKIVLHWATQMFCNALNGERSDNLRLQDMPDHHLVFKPTITQQITELTPRGPVHQFRFFCGDNFIPDIYLSGKSVCIADHVLQRFAKRVPGFLCNDLNLFFMIFYGAPVISMPVGPGRAFVATGLNESLLAFPYIETETEFLLTTCLTINEINSISSETPTRVLSWHYGPQFQPPRLRNWIPFRAAMFLMECWNKKNPLPPPVPWPQCFSNWHYMASCCREEIRRDGHAPGSSIQFLDRIPGPNIVMLGPDETELCHEDWAARTQPDPEQLPLPP